MIDKKQNTHIVHTLKKNKTLLQDPQSLNNYYTKHDKIVEHMKQGTFGEERKATEPEQHVCFCPRYQLHNVLVKAWPSISKSVPFCIVFLEPRPASIL